MSLLRAFNENVSLGLRCYDTVTYDPDQYDSPTDKTNQVLPVD